MKTLLSIFLVGVLVFTMAQTNEMRQREVNAWSTLCELLVAHEFDYQCGDIPRPSVQYVPLAENHYGTYVGDGIIRVNWKLSHSDQESIILHESMHYLHHKLSLIDVPGNDKEVCWSEREAWYIQQYFDNQDYSGWWFNYQSCWPFYGPIIMRLRIGDAVPTQEE